MSPQQPAQQPSKQKQQGKQLQGGSAASTTTPGELEGDIGDAILEGWEALSFGSRKSPKRSPGILGSVIGGGGGGGGGAGWPFPQMAVGSPGDEKSVGSVTTGSGSITPTLSGSGATSTSATGSYFPSSVSAAPIATVGSRPVEPVHARFSTQEASLTKRQRQHSGAPSFTPSSPASKISNPSLKGSMTRDAKKLSTGEKAYKKLSFLSLAQKPWGPSRRKAAQQRENRQEGLGEGGIGLQTQQGRRAQLGMGVRDSVGSVVQSVLGGGEGISTAQREDEKGLPSTPNPNGVEGDDEEEGAKFVPLPPLHAQHLADLPLNSLQRMSIQSNRNSSASGTPNSSVAFRLDGKPEASAGQSAEQPLTQTVNSSRDSIMSHYSTALTSTLTSTNTTPPPTTSMRTRKISGNSFLTSASFQMGSQARPESISSHRSRRSRRLNIHSVSSIVSLLSMKDHYSKREIKQKQRHRSWMLDQQIKALNGFLHELYAEFADEEEEEENAAKAKDASSLDGNPQNPEDSSTQSNFNRSNTFRNSHQSLKSLSHPTSLNTTGLSNIPPGRDSPTPSVQSTYSSRSSALWYSDDESEGEIEAEVDYLASMFPNWTLGDLIGTGASGMVFEGVHPETEEPLFAIKQARIISGHPWLPMPTLFSTIVKILRLTDHANVLKFYGVERVGDDMYIFMEHADGGSLKDVIYDRSDKEVGERDGIKDEEKIKLWIKMTLEGLKYIHKHDIIHRDLKPGNLLLSGGVVKLADFGSSKIYQRCCNQSHMKQVMGSPSYMAPESITGDKEGPKGSEDVWALGCILFEMVLGKPPWFQLDNIYALYYLIGSWASRASGLETEVGPGGAGLRRGGCEKHADVFAEEAMRIEGGKWGFDGLHEGGVWGRGGFGDEYLKRSGVRGKVKRSSTLGKTRKDTLSGADVGGRVMGDGVAAVISDDDDFVIRDEDLTDSDFSDSEFDEDEVDEAFYADEGMIVSNRDKNRNSMDTRRTISTQSLSNSEHSALNAENDTRNEISSYSNAVEEQWELDGDPEMSKFYLSHVSSSTSLRGLISTATAPSQVSSAPAQEAATQPLVSNDVDNDLNSPRPVSSTLSEGSANTSTSLSCSGITIPPRKSSAAPSYNATIASSTGGGTSQTPTLNNSTPTYTTHSTPVPAVTVLTETSPTRLPKSKRHPSLSTKQALPRNLLPTKEREGGAPPSPISKEGSEEEVTREAILASAGTANCMLTPGDCLMRSKALSNPLMTIALESGLFSYEALDFLNLCLQWNPENRPTAADLLDHPFVSSVDWDHKEHWKKSKLAKNRK
ncbi:Suppressor of Sensor Kinase (SLN1) [Chytridiales sp. JEL 0842]|nr:Suppressor of Sensor Kinase (SLN1) [Chytridiales sp. JEL 0842]